MIHPEEIDQISKMATNFLNKNCKASGVTIEHWRAFKSDLDSNISENPTDFLPMTINHGPHRFTMVKSDRGYRLNLMRLKS